jgi:hypothetical protein
LGVITHDTIATSLSTLIDKAESSLRDHLADSPESRHVHLKALYQELRAGLPRRNVYPSARDLFWDDPTTTNQKRCLGDAIAVFTFLRSN